MKWLASSITDLIRRHVELTVKRGDADGREIRVVLQSLPAFVVRQICSDLSDWLATPEVPVDHHFKIAYTLGQKWSTDPDPAIRASFEFIKNKEWWDKQNHLTHYRNLVSTSSDRFVLILLIGVDQVTDQAGLEDFFLVDRHVIWNQHMGGSFDSWLKPWFSERQIACEEDHMEQIDLFLRTLLSCQVMDLVRTSSFLEALNLSAAQDGRDVLRAMGRNLFTFGLPLLRNLPQITKKKTLEGYINDAITFFGYHDYIDETKRKKALKAVATFQEKISLGEITIEQQDLGTYAEPQGLLDDLRKYVENRDLSCGQQLLGANFVFVRDQILKARMKKDAPEKERIKKLSGSPLEVVLGAIWTTLRYFKEEADETRQLAEETIAGIAISGICFRHDCDGEDKETMRENARRLLQKCIGGLDELLQGSLRIAPNPNALDQCLEIRSTLCPLTLGNDMEYRSARASEPGLQFRVAIVTKDGAKIARQFQFRFPEIHPYRNIQALFEWAYRTLQNCPARLPVFTVPFFNELMLTRSDEDANRILLQCLRSDQCDMLDLLGAPEFPPSDPLLPDIKNLTYEYGLFIKTVYEQGFYKGLECGWSLLAAFQTAYKKYVSAGPGADSETGPLLFKAFLTLGTEPMSRSERWQWDPFEPSAVVTALHPSLIEMLEHQTAFLCDVFCHAVEQDLAVTRLRSFTDRKWMHVLDLTKIKLPLTGLLCDANKRLVTQIQDNGLIHFLGHPPLSEATLTTRVLLRYEGADDEEITDADLFRQTRDSVLIERTLADYKQLHPQAEDGIRIAAYCGGDIQPLVAGLDAFVRALIAPENDDEAEIKNYHLSVTVFSETSDDTDVVRWIEEWRDRWNSASANQKFSYYEQCEISVAHRIITPDRNYDQLLKILANSFEADVVFLMNFIGAGSEGNDFTAITPYEELADRRKFPILEKVCCALDKPGYRNRRERVISNRQFRLSTLHAEVMARLKLGKPAGLHHVVMGIGDFTIWEKAVDEFHKRSAWVVCIDPCVDERLVGKFEHGKWLREIIGFGTGVGAHGEHNYTISTEFFHLADLRIKIALQVGELLGPWDKTNNDLIAKSVLEESRRVSGLSLVKATGASEYIRDYVAYALIRKLIPQEQDVVCDQIVSLDAFRHWFDDAPSAKRPDLLHLRARIVDGRIHMTAHLVECKLALQNQAHLDNAHEQLDNGLRHLIACFRPRTQESDRKRQKPDQRYWWLQLHRLIASKSQVKQQDQAKTIAALERLTEGYYSICWQATAATFWCDRNDGECTVEGSWDFEFEGQTLRIDNVATGRNLIRDLCAGTIKPTLPGGAQPLCLAGWQAEPKVPSATLPADPSPPTAVPQSPVAMPSVAPIQLAPANDKISLPSKTSLPSSSPIPARIFLGNDSGGNRPIYWEFGHNQLSNRHLLIFGSSGMGKTYAIQAILCELAKAGQNSLIVDYTNGFEDSQLEPATKEFLKPTQHRVQFEPVPINPFRRQVNLIGDMPQPEKTGNTAQRIKDVFGDVYSLGDQQRGAVYAVVKTGIETYGDKMCLDRLPELLQAMIDDASGQHVYAATVLSKIQPFVDGTPFGHEKPGSWDAWYSDNLSRSHVLQLVGSSKDFARLVTEFSLIDLYWYYRGCGNKDRPRVVVLDEAQNLSHKLDSPVGGLLTEGRKFGFSLILATQTLSNLKQDEQDRMFQAAHKLFFRPAETELQEYAAILANSTGERQDLWVQRLSALKKGECYSLGPSLNQAGALDAKCFKIKISSIETRVAKPTS